MIDTDSQFHLVLTTAVIAGAVGGIAFDLLATYRGRAGHLRLPAKRTTVGRRWDAGVLGSMFLGAVVAVGFLLVYTPDEVLVEEVTRQLYPKYELVAVSLIIGAGGASILRSLTASAEKLAQQAKLETVGAGLRQARAQLTEERRGAVPVTDLTMALLDTVIAQVDEATDEGP